MPIQVTKIWYSPDGELPPVFDSGVSLLVDGSVSPAALYVPGDNGVPELYTGTGVANPMTSALAAGGYKITGLGTPSASTDAATKGYVDGIITGGSWTAGTVNSNANWGANPITYQYSGRFVNIREQVPNTSGYTGNTLVDIDPLPTNRRPVAVIYKPISYYDDSSGNYYTATLKINTDGTMDYYPPPGITPATSDILLINTTYISKP